MLKYFLLLFILIPNIHAQEIAFTFDDAPAEDTVNFKSIDRAKLLIKKLTALSIPRVMIFANPCKGKYEETQAHLSQYVSSGHLIQNHSCSHPRLDDVGAEAYIADIKAGDEKLATLMSSQKYFRYPYLNEGSKGNNRDLVRASILHQNGRARTILHANVGEGGAGGLRGAHDLLYEFSHGRQLQKWRLRRQMKLRHDKRETGSPRV